MDGFSQVINVSYFVNTITIETDYSVLGANQYPC